MPFLLMIFIDIRKIFLKLTINLYNKIGITKSHYFFFIDKKVKNISFNPFTLVNG
jgi:hypothetical protein